MVERGQDRLLEVTQVDITLLEEMKREEVEDIQDKKVILLLGDHILRQDKQRKDILQWKQTTRPNLSMIQKLFLKESSKNILTILLALWKLNSTENS